MNFLTLVADEPCQGLDARQIAHISVVFEHLANHRESLS